MLNPRKKQSKGAYKARTSQPLTKKLIRYSIKLGRLPLVILLIAALSGCESVFGPYESAQVTQASIRQAILSKPANPTGTTELADKYDTAQKLLDYVEKSLSVTLSRQERINIVIDAVTASPKLVHEIEYKAELSGMPYADIQEAILYGLADGFEAAAGSLPAKSNDSWKIGQSRHKGQVEVDFVVINTLFSTDRNQLHNTQKSDIFGTERSNVKYGECKVSIPVNHKLGNLETPNSIWYRFSTHNKNPEDYIMLLSTTLLNYDEFISRIQDKSEKNILIFVHGYNTSFEDAARRTAQIAYDLKFAGTPIFYSWPSQNKLSKYTVDEQNIEWSEHNLKNFLKNILGNPSTENVYLIAHSMGTRALSGALKDILTDTPNLAEKLREVILAAPDIDAEVFKRDIAPALSQTKNPITLYTSSNDLALKASRMVHGNTRLGDSTPSTTVAHGIESIDASNVRTDLNGHAYVGDSPSVLSDMYYIIKEGLRAEDRFHLKPIDTITGRHWEFSM